LRARLLPLPLGLLMFQDALPVVSNISLTRGHSLLHSYRQVTSELAASKGAQ
jgi:hypothetical protein